MFKGNFIDNFILPQMKEEFKKYEKTIKKEYRFRHTPTYKESFRTQVSKTAFFPIALEAIEALEWEITHREESLWEARKPASGFNWGQKITIEFQHGKINVTSKSIQSPFFDFGRNSKRVKLFIHAFQEVEKKFDKKGLADLEEKTNREGNWDDYEIPESLPPPKVLKKPNVAIPIFGGVVLSILLGFIIAFATVNLGYIIGIYEFVVGFLIAFVFKYFIKLSNYTDSDRLTYILTGVVILCFVFNQYFLYLMLTVENAPKSFNFLSFIKLRLADGLKLEALDLGWIGLAVSWIFQVVFTWAIASMSLISYLSDYQLEKIPEEVFNFTQYHFIKGKDEEGVRQELAKMGWSNKKDQDDIFESFGAIQEMMAMNRVD